MDRIHENSKELQEQIKDKEKHDKYFEMIEQYEKNYIFE